MLLAAADPSSYKYLFSGVVRLFCVIIDYGLR